jgi:hypothetical protein
MRHGKTLCGLLVTSGLLMLCLALWLAAWGPATPRPAQAASPALALSEIAPTTTYTWTNLYPDLTRVAAVSSSEAWAVGHWGEILHYTGGAWSKVHLPGTGTTHFYDVSFWSQTGGWAAGGYRAFQYNGTSWVERSEGLGFGVASLYAIAAVGPNEAWASGYIANRQAFMRWDGTRWNPAGPTLPQSSYMNGISMPSANEGWAVGQAYSGSNWYGTVFRYDGTSWQQVSNPLGNAVPRGIYTNPAMPGHAWLTGGDTQSPGAVYHYSNGSWSPSFIPGNIVPGGIYMESETEGYATTIQPITGILRWNGSQWALDYTSTFYLGSVSGAGGSVWAVGRGATAISRVGGTWTSQHGSPTFNALNAVSIVSENDAWAVGEGGVTVRWNGSTWQNVPSTLGSDLRDVQMLSSGEGYAVGQNVIARWDGSRWASVATPPDNLNGVFMSDPGEGWAVGEEGAIWRATGGTWQAVTTPITRTLNAIAFDSPTHGWAVGGDLGQVYDAIPALVEYDNGTWIDRSEEYPPETIPLLHDLVLLPGGEGWAVGSRLTGLDRPIIRLQNGIWTPETSVNNASFSGVDVLPDEVLAVGQPGYRRANGAWSPWLIPTSGGPSGIDLLEGYGGWAVGQFGMILRYGPESQPPQLTPTPPAATATTVPTHTPTTPPQPSATQPVATATNPLPSATSDPPTNTPLPSPPTATPTVCTINFSDVPPGSPFYPYVLCLYCHDVVTGYQDGTFGVNSAVTRGQIAKIVARSAGFGDPVSGQIFADVDPAHTFYSDIMRLAMRGIMGGYECGGPGEPCSPPNNRPYFRPHTTATRGQVAKIVSNAAGYDDDPTGYTFADVLPEHPFYLWIERLAAHGVIGGYSCGGTGEPCDPQDRPYFRPHNNITRGQVAKVVVLAFHPECLER